jgi:D-alanyl-D-alanine carboxypeptidase
MRIKSGSMSGIQCYSGYALPQAKSEKQETLVFSLIINNTTADSYQLRKITDAVLTAILEENK